MPTGARQTIRFGPFELDAQCGQLRRNGSGLRLQGQPIQILEILLERPGQLVAREELRQRLWASDTFVDFDHSLNTAIKKLRQALEDEAETPRYIETLPRRGYRFIAAVKEPTASTTESANGNGRLVGEVTIAQITPTTRKSKFRYLVISIATLAAIVLAGFAVMAYREATLPAPRIVATRRLTHTRLNNFGKIVTDGSRVYFSEQRAVDRVVPAQVSISGGEVSEITTNFANQLYVTGISPSGSELLVEECCPPGKYWIQPIPSGPPRRAPSSLAGWIVWTQDGKYLYRSADKHAVEELRRDGTERKRLFTDPSIDILVPSYSPDGKRIRFTAARGFEEMRMEIMEADIDGSRQHVVFPNMDGQTGFGDWTPDGRLYFFCQWGPGVSLWAVREPKFHFPWTHPKPILLYTGPLQLHFPTASKDGKELFVIGWDPRGELSIYDKQSSSFVPYLGGIPASDVVFSPDHQWIAYVSYPSGTLWKSRIDGSDKMQLTFPPMGVLGPRWSPDGKSIAFTDWYGSDHSVIYVVPADGGQPTQLVTGLLEPSDPTWSPDGRSVAYGGAFGGYPRASVNGHIEILDLNTMSSTKVPGSEGLYSPRWSPDGKFLAALTVERNRLVLYDVRRKQWRKLLDGQKVGWPAWTHDGRYIYAMANRKIYRVDVATAKADESVNLEGVRWTSFAFPQEPAWFGLTPDDRIMILRDTGTQEIYALQLEY